MSTLGIVVLSVCATWILCYFFYGLGERNGNARAEEVEKVLESKVSAYEAVLERAGLSLERDIPERLRREEEVSGSWTGIPIDDRVRPPVGSIARWDEPKHR